MSKLSEKKKSHHFCLILFCETKVSQKQMAEERVYLGSARLARGESEVNTWREGQQQTLEKVGGAYKPSIKEAKTGGALGIPSK